MNLVKISTVVLMASVVLSGCSSLKGWVGKRNDHSLDYLKSHKLDPIKLPANQASGDFIPLYATPNVDGTTSNFTNASGSQYQLPKPPVK